MPLVVRPLQPQFRMTGFSQVLKKCSASQLLSFVLALLIHLVLLAVFYFAALRQNKTPPQFVVLDVEMIGDVAKDGRQKAHHHKNQRSLKDLHEVDSVNEVRHSHAKFESEASDSKQNDVMQKNSQQQVVALFNPLPQIPADLRHEAFESEAIARFFIDQAGNVERVELIKMCDNPRLNSLLLKSLRSWKFAAAGKASTQDVKVKFIVPTL